MLVIGITGGIGCGKGYCCKYFEKAGIPSLDTDKVSRIVTSPGSECLSELKDCFGEEILNPDKSLDRKKLASIVFSDKEKLKMLNKITHKHILKYAYDWAEEKRKEGCFAAIIDAPQLYESGADKKCDIVISVLCDKETRISRVMKRDGMTREEVLKRMSNQHTERFFRNHSDYIISNCDGEDIKGQIEKIIDEIQKKQ